MKTISLLFAVLVLVACSTGFNRDLVAARMTEREVEVTSKKIEEIRKVKPQLPVPFSLGVYLINQDKKLAREIRREIQSVREELVKEAYVSDIFVISDSGLWDPNAQPKYRLKGIRELASRYGADAVLVLNGESELDRYFNPSSLLYLTLVGGFIVPGSHCDALYVLKGSIWDVNNGFLYATAEADGEEELMRPGAFLDCDDALRPAAKKAVGNLMPELKARLRNLAFQASRSKS